MILMRWLIRHIEILLLFFICFYIVLLSLYLRGNVFTDDASLWNRVNMVHFKGAHSDPMKYI